jgi:hypothetical protein
MAYGRVLRPEPANHSNVDALKVNVNKEWTDVAVVKVAQMCTVST